MSDHETELTPKPLKRRLCVMMFLQYFVQGCFLPIVSVYARDSLHFTSQQVGQVMSALSIGLLVAPFIIGQMVDRMVATQYVLAGCHLLGGLTMLGIYTQTDYWPVVLLAATYSLLYAPTLMLTNSLAFQHLKNREREFPTIRVWGTIGFITPAWLVEAVLLRGLSGGDLDQARGVAFALAGIAGLAMGVYSLMLPNTPPEKRTGTRFAPAVVVGMLRRRDVLSLVVVTFGIAIVHNCYFAWNSPFLNDVFEIGKVEGAWEQRTASLGQISEIVVMALLGLSIVRLGFKRTMLIGATAYLARCAIFSLAWNLKSPFELVLALSAFGQCLHGICFGCFLATAYMYLDRISPPDVRGSMQNLYGNFLIGLGFFASGPISGWIATHYSKAIQDKSGTYTIHYWDNIWLAGGVIAAVCLVVFAAWFPKDEATQPS